MKITKHSQIFNPVWGAILIILGMAITMFAGPTYEWFGPEWNFWNYFGFSMTSLGIVNWIAFAIPRIGR